MATHSSVLAWRIPGTGEPGGLPSMGLCCDLAAAADLGKRVPETAPRHLRKPPNLPGAILGWGTNPAGDICSSTSRDNPLSQLIFYSTGLKHKGHLAFSPLLAKIMISCGQGNASPPPIYPSHGNWCTCGLSNECVRLVV